MTWTPWAPAQWFPLVARARPTCPPLDERIGEVCELARAGAGQTGDRLALAAAAHNKAALIASDCGLPELARSLCWQQFDIYLRARPLGGQAARLALEPVVNLARLLIRGGDGGSAYELLDTLYQAVRFHTDAVIDGREVSFQTLTESDEDHRSVCQWLWTVLLGDGTRALVGAGRWDQAMAHAQQRGGIGQRLLDGRQVAVLAHCIAGDPASAATLLNETVLSESWEQPVADCLALLCLRSDARPTDAAVADMVEHYLTLGRAPELLLFRARLGFAVIDLAGGVGQPQAVKPAAQLVGEAVAAGNGYVARDVLAHDGIRTLLTDAEEQALSATVRSSGLGRGAIPAHLMTDLRSAIAISEAATARSLAAPTPASPSA
ncbi:MAG: hypothetical protein QOE61_1675 [Micromonosporaceae bacterium]|nr:hypothetical protein [Micromonosporaceae bacterium]